MQQQMMVELVQGQLDAYNQKDIGGFCRCYHPQVHVYRLPQVEPICTDIEAFRKMYEARFRANPELHAALKSRIVLGESVLDEEWVTGVVGASAPGHVVAIYAFKDNLISHVWFTR